jgi:glyoxylate reductase
MEIKGVLMMKPKVFVTREIPEKGLREIEKYFDIDLWSDYKAPPYEVLVKKASEADALVTLLTDRIDKNLIDNAPRLRIISQYAVGYDNIDIDYATKKGIYVTNTPGVLTDSTADLTIAIMLAIMRRVVEADAFVRKGDWEASGTGWHPLMLLGRELKGKALGIIGMGRIGRAVARRAKGFGMKILYTDVSRLPPEIEKELEAEYVNLKELLKRSDVVSIHTPLTPKTYHMIGEEELKLMKKDAYLVNTARGAIIDTNALVKAIKEGWIAGAALDVFEQEPLPAKHELIGLKNVVLTPHIGSATIEARTAMALKVAENLTAFYHKRVPPDLVNKEVIKMRKPGFG